MAPVLAVSALPFQSALMHRTSSKFQNTGSIDGKLRVWSVLDGSVLAASHLHQDMVTAVAFSPGGSRVVAGTMRGRLRFYELLQGGRKLEYVAQVRVPVVCVLCVQGCVCVLCVQGGRAAISAELQQWLQPGRQPRHGWGGGWLQQLLFER